MSPTQDIAGTPLESEAPQLKATLDGFGADRIVAVFNPLSVPFRAKFARSVTQSPQMSQQDRRMAELGVPVSKDGAPQAHMSQYLVIEAGQTINLPGDVAQVVVRQLVNTILMRRNAGTKSYMLADPKARQDVEQEVIVNFNSVVQEQTHSSEEIFEQQLKELNTPNGAQTLKERAIEPEFPTESRVVPEAVESKDFSGRGETQSTAEPSSKSRSTK